MSSKPKSRTSKSNLTKKAHIPVWAIIIGVLVLVGAGALFVYRSFAGVSYPIVTVYCSRGQCYDLPNGNRTARQAYIRRGDVCLPSIYGQVGYMDLADPKKQWRCLNGNVQ